MFKTPSSNKLTLEIISKIEKNHNKIIVEIGPGCGVFTDKIIDKMNYNDKLILIELNHTFYHKLKEKYKQYDNIIIINDNALNIITILKLLHIEQVDYIISGLPLSAFPKFVSLKILLLCKKVLKQNGIFSLFQYSKYYHAYLKRIFEVQTKFVLQNIPSAFVFHMIKKN